MEAYRACLPQKWKGCGNTQGRWDSLQNQVVTLCLLRGQLGQYHSKCLFRRHRIHNAGRIESITTSHGSWELSLSVTPAVAASEFQTQVQGRPYRDVKPFMLVSSQREGCSRWMRKISKPNWHGCSRYN